MYSISFVGSDMYENGKNKNFILEPQIQQARYSKSLLLQAERFASYVGKKTLNIVTVKPLKRGTFLVSKTRRWQSLALKLRISLIAWAYRFHEIFKANLNYLEVFYTTRKQCFQPPQWRKLALSDANRGFQLVSPFLCRWFLLNSPIFAFLSILRCPFCPLAPLLSAPAVLLLLCSCPPVLFPFSSLLCASLVSSHPRR